LDFFLVLAAVASQTGSMKRAARLLGALNPFIALADVSPLPREQAMIDTATETVRTALGEETWAAACQAGRALSLEDAVAEALGETAAVGQAVQVDATRDAV
jgi:hypothetical protein